jgi:hypothetical protein
MRLQEGSHSLLAPEAGDAVWVQATETSANGMPKLFLK